LDIARTQTPSTVQTRIPVFGDRRCQLPLLCPVLPPFRLLLFACLLLHSLKVITCGGWGWSVSTKAIVSSTRLLTKLSRHRVFHPPTEVNVASSILPNPQMFVLSQISHSLVAHPLPSENYVCRLWSGVELLSRLLSLPALKGSGFLGGFR
jgi:hypothetical protein